MAGGLTDSLPTDGKAEPCEVCDPAKLGTEGALIEFFRIKDSKCLQCKFLVGAIEAFCVQEGIATSDVSSVQLHQNEGALTKLSLFLKGQSDLLDLEFTGEEAYVRPGQSNGTIPRSFTLNRKISPRTDSEEAVHWAQERLQACNLHHGICREVNEYYTYHSRDAKAGPLRLVSLEDLDPSDWDGSLVTIRENAEEIDCYVSVSYCWGTTQRLILDQRNYEYLLGGLSLSQLPPTIKEALQLVWQLGYRYVWVDALCIRQDHPEEIAQQIEYMGVIYSKADLTIAIVKSPDIYHGSFNAPASCYTGVDLSAVATSISPRGWDRVRKPRLRRSLSHPIPHRQANQAVAKRPLTTRAWALQEQWLALRVLILAEHELIWQCACMFACECGTGGDSHSFAAILADHHHGRAEAAGGRELHVWLWQLASADYCRRRLSLERDRPVALRGLIRHFEILLGDRCVAGLWMKAANLQACLGWRIGEPAGDGVGRNYGFPTWSWLSVAHKDGVDLSYPFDPNVNRERVTDSDFDYEIKKFEEGDPLRVVTGAEHYISGLGILLTAILRAAAFQKKDVDGQEYFEGIEILERVAESGEFWPDNDFGHGNQALHADMIFELAALPSLDERQWFLVLQAIEEGSRKYKRVGVYSCSLKELEASTPVEQPRKEPFVIV